MAPKEDAPGGGGGVEGDGKKAKKEGGGGEDVKTIAEKLKAKAKAAGASTRPLLNSS